MTIDCEVRRGGDLRAAMRAKSVGVEEEGEDMMAAAVLGRREEVPEGVVGGVGKPASDELRKR